jgi:hypothetical protein
VVAARSETALAELARVPTTEADRTRA